MGRYTLTERTVKIKEVKMLQASKTENSQQGERTGISDINTFNEVSRCSPDISPSGQSSKNYTKMLHVVITGIFQVVFGAEFPMQK